MLYVAAIVALFLLLPRLFRRWMMWRRQSPAERSFAIRFAVFMAVLAVILVVTVLHLPPLPAAMLLLPIFVTGLTLATWWQSSRERLRRRAEEEASFQRARRIN